MSSRQLGIRQARNTTTFVPGNTRRYALNKKSVQKIRLIPTLFFKLTVVRTQNG